MATVNQTINELLAQGATPEEIIRATRRLNELNKIDSYLEGLGFDTDTPVITITVNDWDALDAFLDHANTPGPRITDFMSTILASLRRARDTRDSVRLTKMAVLAIKALVRR